MTTIPTQNAVPSEAPRDLKFNSGKIDEFVTSLEHEYKDRFGRSHLTIEGIKWMFDQLVERFKVDMNQAIIAAGYITMDSFQQGAEITKRNEILRDETTGEYYRWDGDLPKSVPVGSTPESSGGIGVGKWVGVGDASLRNDLMNGDGSKLIGAGGGLTQQDVNDNLHILVNAIVVTDKKYGVSETNSPAENTRIWEDIVMPDVVNGKMAYIPAGIYNFDVLRCKNASLYGDGINKTVIRLHDNHAVKVLVQADSTTIKGVSLRAVKEDSEWTRCDMGDNSLFEACEISGFRHNPEFPNSWGILLSKCKNNRIIRCAFDDNTQSDIAVVEGVENLLIDGCYSLSNNLVINFEPNINNPQIKNCKISQCNIKVLHTTSNDSLSTNNNCLVVENCDIGLFDYRGLGVTLINTKIKDYKDGYHTGGFNFASRLSGVNLGDELIGDPFFADISSTAGMSFWYTLYSTLGINHNYRRIGERLVVGSDTPGTVQMASRSIAISPYEYQALCITTNIGILNRTGDVNFVTIEFSKDFVTFPPELARKIYFSEFGAFNEVRSIVSIPDGANSFRVIVTNGFSQSGQSISVGSVSVRHVIPGDGIGTECSATNSFPKSVTLGYNFEQYSIANLGMPNLPVGTIVIFKEKKELPGLCVVNALNDSPGSLGELTVVSKYP